MDSNTYPELQSMQAGASLESRKASSATEDQLLASLQVTVRKGTPQQHLRLDAPLKIDVKRANFYYGSKQALFDIVLPIRERQITALIGPSGSGKSTFLRTLNRMNDLIPQSRTEGQPVIDEENFSAQKPT